MYQAVCEALLRLGEAKGTLRPAEDLTALPSEVAGQLNELVHGNALHNPGTECLWQSAFAMIRLCDKHPTKHHELQQSYF